MSVEERLSRTQDDDQATGVKRKVARLLTEALAPAPIAAALILVVAMHSSRTIAEALGWSLVAILFGCVLPLGFVMHQVGRRRMSDRHVFVREQRVAPITVGLISVLVGYGVLFFLGAPRQLIVVLVAMVAGLVVSLLITLAWKISVHTGTVAGAVLIVAYIFGPAYLALEGLAVAVGWARVEVGDHTPAQVIGGGLVGVLVASAIVFLS